MCGLFISPKITSDRTHPLTLLIELFFLHAVSMQYAWLEQFLLIRFVWAGKSFALVFLHQSSSTLRAMKLFLSRLNWNGGSTNHLVSYPRHLQL
jgi:hypothetical protein